MHLLSLSFCERWASLSLVATTTRHHYHLRSGQTKLKRIQQQPGTTKNSTQRCITTIVSFTKPSLFLLLFLFLLLRLLLSEAFRLRLWVAVRHTRAACVALERRAGGRAQRNEEVEGGGCCGNPSSNGWPNEDLFLKGHDLHHWVECQRFHTPDMYL